MTKPHARRSQRPYSSLFGHIFGGLLALSVPLAAQAAAAPAFSISFDAATAGTYVPGQTRQVKITYENTGDAATGNIDLTLASLPTDVTVQATGRSCSITGSGSPASSCGTAGSGSGGAAGLLYHNAVVQPGHSLEITATLVFDADAVGSKTVTASQTATATTVDHEFTRVPITDLATSVTAETIASPLNDCPGDTDTYTPGCAAAYTVVVQNNGPDAAGGATFSIKRFEGALLGFNWTCSASGTGVTCPATSGSTPLSNVAITTFPKNGKLTYAITVNHTVNDSYSSTGIDASVSLPTTPAGMLDTNTGNNSSGSASRRTRNAAANLSAQVSQTAIATPATDCPGGTTSYTPGCRSTFTVEFSNAGPDAANNAKISLARSEAAGAAIAWTCTASGSALCPAASGTGALSAVAAVTTFPKNGKLTYAVTVDHGSGELYATAGIDAEITVPTGTGAPLDIDHADNLKTVASAIDRRAKVRVTKRALQNGQPVTSVFANNSFDYEITVYNDGPSDIGNAGVDPANPQFDTTGPKLRLTDTFDTQLVGVSANGCTSVGNKPCWAYCRSSLSGLAEGTSIATATNCKAGEQGEGSGVAIDQGFALRAGTGSRLLTRVNVPAVSAVTTINNTANVALTACPAAPAACSGAITAMPASVTQAQASVDVTPASAATIQVQNIGDGTAVPGAAHSYKVTVRNVAFNNLSETTIQASLPLFQGGATSGFIPGSAFYSCRAFDGASCTTINGQPDGQSEPTPPVYANALSVVTRLPQSSRVEFTITGMLDPRASTAATLSAQAHPQDAPDVAGSVSTTMLPQVALTLSKRLYKREDQGAVTRLFYEIVAGNNGPSLASNVTLRDGAGTVGSPGDFNFPGANWTCQAVAAPPPAVAPEATSCSATTGTGGIGDGGPGLNLALMPGGSAVVKIDVVTTASAGAQVENVASLSHVSGTREARVTTSLRANYTLEVQKDDGLSVAHPGAPHQYTVSVLNHGPDDAYDVHVQDTMPAFLQNVNWTCAATSPVPGDLAPLQVVVGPTPAPGEVVSMSADGRSVYVIGRTGSGDPAIYVYARNATPGLGYGLIAASPLEVEVNGVDDPSDTGSAVAGMEAPVDMSLSRDGNVLYVLSSTGAAGKIIVFHRVSSRLDPEFGKLSYAGTVATAMKAPRRLVMSATHLYVAGSIAGPSDDASQIETFRPDNNNQLPVAITAGVNPAPAKAGPILIDATHGWLYVASMVNSRIRRFQISASGSSAGQLTQDVETDYQQVGYAGIRDLVLAPNARDLYFFAWNNGAPRIGHARGEVTGISFTAQYGAASPSLASAGVRIALTPDGEHLLGVNPAQDVLFSMRRNPLSGGLSGGDVTDAAMEQVLKHQAGSNDANMGLDKPSHLVVSPDNRHVVVASASTTGSIGPITVFSRRAPAPQLGFIEMDHDGDPIAGTQDAIDSMVAPADVVSRGRFVYVLSKVDSAINLFERRLLSVGPDDEDGGHLTFIASWRNGRAGVTGMASPDRILISPDGNSLFVSSVDGNSLAVFRRDPADGSLVFARSFLAAAAPGLQGAFGMAMDPASANLYVAGSFASSIAIFAHDAISNDRLAYKGAVVAGQNGVTGLDGIRDLVVAGQGSASQLLGVANAANTVVVFDRQNGGANAGALSFVQALALGANQRPTGIAISPDIGNSGNAHVYVAAQNASAVHVLQRVLDSGDPQFGRVRKIATVSVGNGAPQGLAGARDVTVSGDGKRVYAVGEYGHSLVAFNRYDNPSSPLYGQIAFAEARTQDVDAVDGIAAPYAVAVSEDSRNVYVAGFDSNAVASFSVGTGSSCSASGSGDIDDLATIRAGGAVVYSITSTIRPDASGVLSNTATATGATQPASGSKVTPLLTSAQLKLTKTNHQVAVVPGTEVTYDITVGNDGPGNVRGLDDPALANVSDLFGCTAVGGSFDCSNSPFEQNSISWTCSATGSGMLDFLASYADDNTGSLGLRGIGSLALIPAGPSGTGTEVRDNFLAGASVDDDSVVFFKRDAATGALVNYPAARLHDGPSTPLQGARSVSVSRDGRLLFVASRQSDSLNVFGLSGSGSQALVVTPLAMVKDPTILGLDKALHVISVPAAAGIEHVYVAGANDHAVAAFTFNRGSNTLTHIGSWVNGVAGVQGLADVEHLVLSPDDAQVYALSGSSGTVVQFNRNPATGQLTYVARFTGGMLGTDLSGVSSGAFDATGKRFYLTASGANRLVQLARITDPAAGNFGSLSLVTAIGQGEQGAQGLLNPRRVVLTPDGHHLYVTSQAGSSVAWFTLHPQTGKPSYGGIRSNQSAGVSGLAGATGMVLDAQRNQLYIAGTLDRAIVHFQRQSDSWCPPTGTGLLDAVPVNIAAQGEIAFRITARVSSQLQGSLVNVANAYWTSASCSGGAGPTAQNCDVGALDEDQPSSIANLSITKDDGLAEFDGLAGANAVAADARNVYVAAPSDNAIGAFQRQAGAPTGVGLRYLGVARSGVAGVSGLGGVLDLAASADGNHLYAVSPADGAITVFSRAPLDGRLGFVEKHQNGLLGVSGMMGARAVVLSPDGAHVYVAGGFSNSIAIFRRQAQAGTADYGKLQFMDAIQAGIGGINGIESPQAMVMSADGKQLYVLGGAGNTLVAFARQSNSGSGNFGKLTQLARYQNASGGVLGMDGVRSLALSGNGAHLYVLGADAGSLVHFARNPADGSLSFVPAAGGGSLLLPELVGATRVRSAGNGHLYAASAGQAAIVEFELDGAGVPTLLRTIHQGDASSLPGKPDVDGLAGIADVAFVADAPGWIYTGAAGDSALSVFQIDNGEPGYIGSVFDGAGGVAPGDAVTYTIVVTNNGPSNVAQARVVDAFPPEFEQVGWTCVGYAGGDCPPSGNGNLDLLVNLPNGGQVQFAATGIVRAQAAGRLVNTATVEAVGVLDPDTSDNSATDDDTVLAARMNLSITVDDDGCNPGDPGCTTMTQATPGGSVAYRVIAANVGPSYARGAIVSDTLPASLHDVAWTCEAVPQAGLLQEVNLLQANFDTAYRAVTVDPLGRHVYAVGKRSQGGVVRDTLVVFSRDALSGALTRIQAYSEPAGTGEPEVHGIAGAVDVVVSNNGRFVYVAGHDADAIAVFERDLATGALTWRSQVKDSEQGVDGIGGVSSLVLSPDGKHLYAAGAASQAIAGFAINAGSGALTQVSVLRQGNGINGLNGVSDLAFNASGGILFATASTNRSLTALRRAPASGVLASLTTIEDGQVGVAASLLAPSALAVDGERVFVADAQGDAVSLLHFVDGDTPAFVLDAVIALDADGVAGTQAPIALGFVPDQQRLYVAASASSQLHLYSLLGTNPEHLASYGPTDSAALAGVAAFVLAPGANELHAVSGSSGRINTMARQYGSRCPLTGVGGLGQQNVDIAPGGFVRFDLVGSIFANATGELRYAVAVDPRVLAQESDPSDNRATDIDTLTPSSDLETHKLRQTPDAEVIAGRPVQWRIEVGNHGISDALDAQVIDDLPLFPADPAGLDAQSGAWSCASNPPLEAAARIDAATEPRVADLSALVHVADGRRWFAVSRSRGELVELGVDASGTVQSVQTRFGSSDIAELAGATHLALSPDGAYLYVTSSTVDGARSGADLSAAERDAEPNAVVTGNLLVFKLRADGLDHLETLTSGVDGVVGLRGAKRVLASNDGRFVYVAAVPASINNSAIALFRRDADSGELSFVERIQDGLGTFGSESNVIRDIRNFHLTADGRNLYVLANGSTSPAQPNQQSLSRFALDPATGRLSYIEVQRAVDIGSSAAVVSALTGARDLVAAPGDTQFYVAAAGGIAQFARAVNGGLSLMATWPAVEPWQTRAMAMDAWGSRLQLVDTDGNVHLYARQWNDGSLRHHYSLAPATTAAATALLQVAPMSELVLAQGGADGGLTIMTERAISRCLAANGGNADLPARVDIGVNGWSSLAYGARVHPSARGTLVNTAHALPVGGDPVPGNDLGSDQALIHVESDLSVHKTGPATAVAGEYVEYVIRVDNAGPSDALGIHVRDQLDPARFQDPSWTCAIEGSGGSLCASATGSGAPLDAEADLHVGDTLKITLRVKVHPAWIGALVNAAYVVPEPGSVDPTPDDHVAEPVETTVERRADLAVTKTTDVAEVVAGAPIVYSVTVHNQGPSDAPQVRVRDTMPVQLRGITWTCTAQGGIGACGNATGLGSIDDLASIPVGATLVYQVNAIVRSSASGDLVNSANAALVGAGLDPDTGNNSASVSNVILQRADLQLTVTAPDAFDPASTAPMPYQVVVTNAGPSDAALSTLAIQFSHPVRQNNAACTPQTGTQFNCLIDSIPAGAVLDFPLDLRQLPAVPATLTANVGIGSQTADPAGGNNVATTSTVMRTGVDLDVTIDDGRIGLAPGDATRYQIRVRNVGSVDAVDARVLVPLASELLAAQWQCTAPAGAYCSASGSGGIDDLVNVPAGATLVYTLDATLDPDINALLQDTYSQGVQVLIGAGQTEVSTQNNTASDTNRIFKVIFKDGFEDPVVPRPQAPQADAALLPASSFFFLSMPDAAPPPPPARASVRRSGRAGGRA